MSFEDDCIKERGRPLTGRFAHYCYDWDGMTVDETCPGEITSCHCTIEGVGEVPAEVKAEADAEMVRMEEEFHRQQLTERPTPPDPSST